MGLSIVSEQVGSGIIQSIALIYMACTRSRNEGFSLARGRRQSSSKAGRHGRDDGLKGRKCGGRLRCGKERMSGCVMCGTLCRGEMFVIRLAVHERTTYRETPIAKPTPAQPIIDLT